MQLFHYQYQTEINFDDLDLTVPEDKIILIGITGEPGAGKTALAKEFEKLGASIINADEAGHAAIEMPATKKKIVEIFGKDILDEDKKTIDRAKLSAKAFLDEESTAALNKIVHPKITAKLKALLKKAANFTIIDAALLHELGFAEGCSHTI